MDPKWIVLGFSLAALAMGYGWWSEKDQPTDPESPEDPLAGRYDPLALRLKRLWNRAFWQNPVCLLVVAIVMTPLGGFIAGPVLGGRAAEIWGRRAGYEHSIRLGVAVGAVWFALFWLAFFLVVW